MRAVRLLRLPAVRRSDRARESPHQSMPARRRCGHSRTIGADRVAVRSAQSGQRSPQAAHDRADRRGSLHRVHDLHPEVSDRCDRRLGKGDAHGSCRRAPGATLVAPVRSTACADPARRRIRHCGQQARSRTGRMRHAPGSLRIAGAGRQAASGIEGAWPRRRTLSLCKPKTGPSPRRRRAPAPPARATSGAAERPTAKRGQS